MSVKPIPNLPILPLSDQAGLNSMRLYTNLKTNALKQMLLSENLVLSVGIDGVLSLSSLVEAICAAVAAEVIAEIKNHSKLQEMPGARDKGYAGAGIISGFLK